MAIWTERWKCCRGYLRLELKVKGGEVSPRPLCLALKQRVPDGLEARVQELEDEFELEHGSPLFIYRLTDLSIDRLDCGI